MGDRYLFELFSFECLTCIFSLENLELSSTHDKRPLG